MAENAEPFELANCGVIRVRMHKQRTDKLLSRLENFWIEITSGLCRGLFAAH